MHAVGIGAAGWVDADRNRVLFAPHLSWRNEPLRDRLSGRLAVPVLVDNDANTAAWAEWRFGAGRGEDHLVMITLGTGIGGAILEDGQVKRGKFGVAGEFGHMQVVPGGHRCPCGNRGCWEQYSSGNALVREARELAAADSPVAYGIIEHVKGNISEITGPMITELAREGDAMCIELLQDIGQWLGVGIANLAAALDPSCFVIGGGVSAADDLLIGPARDAFRRHLTGRGYRPEARIARAQLGPEAGMVGAADLARLVARRFRRAKRRRVERYERYERYAESRRSAPGHRCDGLAAAPGLAPATSHRGRPRTARHMIRRRALTLLIIVLLIGVPAGYLVISANQSRDSGKDKEAKYSATGLTPGWPSKRPAPPLPGAHPGRLRRGRVLRDEQLEDQPPLRPVPHQRRGPGQASSTTIGTSRGRAEEGRRRHRRPRPAGLRLGVHRPRPLVGPHPHAEEPRRPPRTSS